MPRRGVFAIVTDAGRGMRWTRQPAAQIHFHAVATIPYQWHLGFDFGFSEFWLDGQVETGILRFGPVPLEGRLAIVTNAGRDAVDADGAADERR